MKKILSIICSLIFVSSIFSFNSNTKKVILEGDPFICWEVADAALAAYQEAQLKFNKISTHYQEFLVWQQAYDSCM